MSGVLNKTVELVLAKPEYSRYLKQIVEYEKEHCNDEYFHIGWRYDDVSVPGHILYQLAVKHGILRVVSTRSRGPANYLLVDRGEVEKALNVVEDRSITEAEEGFEIPPDLFDVIVGYDGVKTIFKACLNSPRPTHCLLVGSVSTAKSLFLEEINRIRGSSYHSGSSTSKAGLSDFLFIHRPRILLIDEFDKMSREDYAVLLSLMESGKVTETKYHRRREEHMDVWVFATANTLRGVPPENVGVRQDRREGLN